MSIYSLRRYTLFAFYCLICQTSTGQVTQLKNPSFDFKPAVHAALDVPTGWEASQDSRKKIRMWNSPGSTAVAVGRGASISQNVSLDALPKKLTDLSEWRLLMSLDVTGKFSKSNKPAEIWASIEDGKGKVLARKTLSVNNSAPISKIVKPFFWASSFKANSAVTEFAFDGDPKTIWHSKWGGKEPPPKHPHFLACDFGEVKKLSGLTYLPNANLGNGTLGKYAVETTVDGTQWNRILLGELKYPQGWQEQFIRFKRPAKCRGFRLVFLSAYRGDGFASCAELIPAIDGWKKLVAKDAKKEQPAPAQRLFLSVDSTLAQKLSQVKISFGAESNRFVVVDRADLFYAPQVAHKKMSGRSNGGLGPDFLGAGSYGFSAMMLHQYSAIPIIEVFPDSPAAKAGLRNTDLIVGINGKYLPPGNVAPGFEWYETSHEALLGRAAIESAAKNGKVELKVFRDDKVVDLDLKLKLPKEIANADFLTAPKSLELINADLIAHVVAKQKKDGSWVGNPIATCLCGLALLSTHDQSHAARIKAAANWTMARNAEPGAGFYWHPSFAGIFLCEYYLATGDERVLPVIERLIRLMNSAFHTSKFGMQTFGHGPKRLPYGNKSLVAVMVHVTLFEELASRCGIKSNIYKTLTPFLDESWSDPATGGHGAMGYNPSHKDLGEFWARTGLYGLTLKMRGIGAAKQAALVSIMHERFPWFRNSHAYGEPGGLLGLIGMAQMNPAYFKETFSKYRWWFGLAWDRGAGLHFTIPHMGAPYMECTELINGGYAVVTNAHKKTLQITGGKKKNWLDVSKIPEPISPVMILQNSAGDVSMRCHIPGPEIYYTVDGAQPNPRSKQFTAPFKVAPGSIVKAIAVNESGKSKIAERQFWLGKTEWRIVSATGGEDKNLAIESARNVIDGDNLICWVPDGGEGAKGYPHELVIDTGRPIHVQAARVKFVFDKTAASRISVFGSSKRSSGFKEIGRQQNAKYEPSVSVAIKNKKKIRYLKLVFEVPFDENPSPVLMVGEVDVR